MRLFAAALLFCATSTHALGVSDDAGQRVDLARPAARIVSLAPHLTELLFAAGAGGQIVGASQYSDYPEAAKKLPQVGGYELPDLETIIALKPDLVVAWQSGNPPAQVARLKALGIPVFVSEPRHIQDVATSIERLGILSGHEQEAARAARDFRRRHAVLAARYAGRPPVRVFYQIWAHPIMTVNGAHLIADVMKLCGAVNVFSALPALTPTLSEEAVLGADPDAIVASGMDGARPPWLDEWRRWPGMRAVRNGHLYFVPPDLLHRNGPRILDGAGQFCERVERAR